MNEALTLNEAQQRIVDEYRRELARLMLQASTRLQAAGLPAFQHFDEVYAATEKVVEDGMYTTLIEFGE